MTDPVGGKGLGIRGAPDRYLLKLLGQAHRYKAMVMRGHGETISQLATGKPV